MTKIKFLFLFLTALTLFGCSPSFQDNQLTPTPSLMPTSQPTQTTQHTPSPPPTQNPPTLTPAQINEICSPLKGESLSELNDIITQPFKTPRPGNDDGHTGVDYAFYRRKDMEGIEGLPVLAAIEGKVVSVILDRFPYGFAVMIETPLESMMLQ